MWRRSLLLGVLALGGVAQAGPWSPEPGHGFTKLWTKWLPGFGYYPEQGPVVDYGAYHEVFVAGYAEVGVLPRVALTAHTDLVRVFHLVDPVAKRGQTHVGPGDPALGLRAQWLQAGRWAAAVEVSGRAPLAVGTPVQDVVSDDGDVIGGLTIGSGTWDVSTLASVGHGWDRAYVAAAGGMLWRFRGYDHAVQWTAEGGTTLGEHWAWRTRITGMHPLDTGDAPRHNSPSGLGNGTSYVGFALEADRAIGKGWRLGGTLEGGMVRVRRQSGGPVLSVAVARSW